jgi:hypothetical protein
MFGERLARCCQLCMLGAHSYLFECWEFILLCFECWELILLCFECWELIRIWFEWWTSLYIVYAGSSLCLVLNSERILCVFIAWRLLLFCVNDGPYLLFVQVVYFLRSHQITTRRPNNFLLESVRWISAAFRDIGLSQLWTWWFFFVNTAANETSLSND